MTLSKRLQKEAQESLAQEEATRAARQHEQQLAKVEARLRISEAKRKQAEADLETERDRNEFYGGLPDPKSMGYEFKPHKASGQATAVIVLSDWHVEETVEPESVNGLNEYNLEIASKRIQKTFENAVLLLESARHLSNIKDLVVACLGDFITGYIHEELVESNSLSPTEATIFVEDHLTSGLDFLAKHSGCKSITVPTAFGNHGRTTPKMRISTSAANSYEWLMYKHLERYYRNTPKIKWKVEDGYHNWIDIQGKAIRFHHGDAIQYAGGIGGPTVPTLRAIATWNDSRQAAWDVFGHLHSNIWHDRFLLNNCLIGHSALAVKWKMRYSDPSQLFFVVDQKRATPVMVQKIFCN